MNALLAAIITLVCLFCFAADLLRFMAPISESKRHCFIKGFLSLLLLDFMSLCVRSIAAAREWILGPRHVVSGFLHVIILEGYLLSSQSTESVKSCSN